jgi:hypothetical protein
VPALVHTCLPRRLTSNAENVTQMTTRIKDGEDPQNELVRREMFYKQVCQQSRLARSPRLG